jgi:arylsulfatase
MKPNRISLGIQFTALVLLATGSAWAQDVLPFPAPPMGGKVAPTMQESVHKWREAPSHLPEDAPNILIIMMDDAGFGQASTFGGEIHTPTLSRLAAEGISYNRFHTTAQCSPTRAALMTGRNHHRVGAGQIAEFANDWDGYTGVIPKSSATITEVLGHYGYASAAFGKEHNTPVDQIANGLTTAPQTDAAMTTFMASWPVKLRNGNPSCGRTRPRSNCLTWRITRTFT